MTLITQKWQKNGLPSMNLSNGQFWLSLVLQRVFQCSWKTRICKSALNGMTKWLTRQRTLSKGICRKENLLEFTWETESTGYKVNLIFNIHLKIDYIKLSFKYCFRREHASTCRVLLIYLLLRNALDTETNVAKQHPQCVFRPSMWLLDNWKGS